MRKTVFFLFFLWSALVLRAGNVDADMAKRIARQFFLSRNLPAETSSLRMLDAAPVTTRSTGEPWPMRPKVRSRSTMRRRP